MTTALSTLTVGQRGQVPDEVPFSLVDEAVHLLDGDQAPLSIQLEVRVKGHLDPARLRYAIRCGLDAHPMARARRVASSRRAAHDRWAIGPFGPGEVLRVVDCPDDDHLTAARAELQSLRVPLLTSPPLLAWLARHPAGDVLMLNVHHAAMDGFGAVRVLRSIVRAYAGVADPASTVDFVEARGLPERLAAVGFSTRLRRGLALAERLRDLVTAPARIARDGGIVQAGYGFQLRALSVAETEALLAGEHEGTVNDVLVAALHLTIAAWNAEHGVRCRRIGVLVPANLRPVGWREDMAGNFALPARVSSDPRSRRSRRAVLASVTAQTGRKKRTGMGTAFLELLGPSGQLPLWAKRSAVKLLPLTGDRMVDTTMFSNLGSTSEPLEFGDGAGEATEVWFSPPARMPLGVSVGAITAGGRLHLSFRHRRRQCDDAAARRFADRYMTELAHLTTQLNPRRPRRAIGGYGLGATPPVYPPYRSALRRSLASRHAS